MIKYHDVTFLYFQVWGTCKVMLSPSRSMGRILTYDPTTVASPVAKRAFEILEEIDFDETLSSPPSGAIYVWVMLFYQPNDV